MVDNNVNRNTTVCLFADDTQISSSCSDASERHELQEQLDDFMMWTDRWQLQIAEHKCCVLTHGNVVPPMYHMKVVPLLNVSEFRDLGVIIDSHCIFKQHIPLTCRKAYICINVICRCFHTANVHALQIAYKSYVRPILEYYSTVWNPFIAARHFVGMTD